MENVNWNDFKVDGKRRLKWMESGWETGIEMVGN